MVCARSNRSSSVIHGLGSQDPLAKQSNGSPAVESRELSHIDSVHICSRLHHRLGICAFAQFAPREIERFSFNIPPDPSTHYTPPKHP